MREILRSENRGLIFTAAVVLFLMAVVALMPRGQKTEAIGSEPFNHTGEDGVTRSFNPNLPNYDIRIDKSDAAQTALAQFRNRSNKADTDLMAVRQEMLNGEAELRERVPTLVVEYDKELGVPEVIGTDVLKRTFLDETNIPANKKHAEAVRRFLQGNNSLLGLQDEQISKLKVIADYTNPDGNLSYVDLGQEINGIPVFRGEIRAGITKDGRIFRMINNLAPGLEYASLSTNAGRAEDAVFTAAKYINRTATANDVRIKSVKNEGRVVEFDNGQFDWPTTAEQMYFPTEPGVAVLAWRVLFWEPVAAHYVIIDAEKGELLWRKNIVNDQTQQSTYNVYLDDNPAPLSPGPNDPGAGTQGTLINRTSVTKIGNEAPFAFNNLGWITDGSLTTDGNNVQAGIDRDGSNGVDATGMATATVNNNIREFIFTYTPGHGTGDPTPGEAPVPTPYPPMSEYQKGIVTNLFYWNNVFHDRLYQVGFTEQARNFQNDNFGRGGNGNDRVSAEAQDSSGTNNANFGTPADGGRGRMQMYIWTAMNPDRDGDLDQDIIIHEHTHGLSNRLIGNGGGLTGVQAGGMGEGWSDFYGRLLLATADENVNTGMYVTGGYSVYLLRGATWAANYYYGIRHFPYTRISNLGPNGNPHNPLTYADIDPVQANITNGAYPAATSWSTGSVHALGEVWCSMLFEVRARMINRLGFETGNQRMLQLVTDAMKVTPLNPNFLQSRDAILAADQAGFGGADTGDIWAGFAVRGAGFGATNTTGQTVVESFNLPNLLQTPTFTFTDANNNGYAEPGEALVLTVPINNPLNEPATNTTVSVNGGSAVSYGTINGGQTVTQQINYTVPSNQPCGSELTLTFAINSSLGATQAVRKITVGVPQVGAQEGFDTVTVPALPTGWVSELTGSGSGWATQATSPDSGANSVFANDPATAGGSDLTTPNIPIASAAAKLTFRNNYNTEPTWDGGALEISIPTVNGGAFQDIVTAGGSFATGGYNGTLRGTGNPLLNRQGWTGNSNGYITTTVNLPAAANGQNVKFKFRTGHDSSVAGTGWRVDSITVISGYNCGPTSCGTAKRRADFDADAKADLSIFRSGTWWVNRSGGGTSSVPFGTAGDRLVPGDYDRDNKTDYAVVRNGTWYVLRSSDSTVEIFVWGFASDIPVPGDYDGDGFTDAAVYRGGTWYVRNRTTGGILLGATFGIATDVPVVGDFDGDCKTDLAVRRTETGGNANYYLLRSTDGFVLVPWGFGTDATTIGDFDGDGGSDIAIVRNNGGTLNWWGVKTNGTVIMAAIPFGAAGDVPVVADYDGDGKDDRAVFRNGTWYVFQSSNNSVTIQSFGMTGDEAVARAYQP